MEKITLGELLLASLGAWTAFPDMGSTDGSFTFAFDSAEARDAFIARFNGCEVELPGSTVKLNPGKTWEKDGQWWLSFKPAAETLSDQILEFVRRTPGSSIGDIYDGLSMASTVIAPILGDLHRAGKLTRTANGGLWRYRYYVAEDNPAAQGTEVRLPDSTVTLDRPRKLAE